MEETLREKAQLAIVYGVHDKPPDGKVQNFDSRCKKRAFVIGQEVRLDHSHPRFLPKELHSCESITLRVIRSLLGGVLEFYH